MTGRTANRRLHPGGVAMSPSASSPSSTKRPTTNQLSRWRVQYLITSAGFWPISFAALAIFAIGSSIFLILRQNNSAGRQGESATTTRRQGESAAGISDFGRWQILKSGDFDSDRNKLLARFGSVPRTTSSKWSAFWVKSVSGSSVTSEALQYRVNQSSVVAFPHKSEGPQPFTQGLHLSFKQGKDDSNDANSTTIRTALNSVLDRCLERYRQSLINPTEYENCIIRNVFQVYDLFESSGLYERSYVHIKSLAEENAARGHLTGDGDMGDVPKLQSVSVPLPRNIFAEGFTEAQPGEFYVATWQERKILKMRKKKIGETSSLEILGEIYLSPPPREGWGMVSDGANWMLMSDGSNAIYFFEMEALGKRGRIGPKYISRVFCDGKPLNMINEMDYHAESKVVWANVWHSPNLYAIDVLKGQCVGKIQLDRELKGSGHNPSTERVWNGVASISQNWFLLTGKMFDYIYIVRIDG